MLQEDKKFKMSEGEELNAKTEWSPYNPANADTIERSIRLDTPKLDELDIWMGEKVLGYSGITVDKYIEMDAELLVDKLNDILVNEDEFRFLNWLFRIVRSMNPDENNLVFQMPEDFFRVFCRDTYKSLHNPKKFILFAVVVKVDSIYNQFEPDSKENKTCKNMYVLSLKALALIALLFMKIQKDGKLDGEPVEFTYSELCAQWPKIKDEWTGWFDDMYDADESYIAGEDEWSKISYLGDGRCAKYLSFSIGFTEFLELTDLPIPKEERHA